MCCTTCHSLDPAILGADVRLRFGETTGPLPPVTVAIPLVGTLTLNFSVTTTAFADPNPLNATADSDADGIPENAEASLDTAFRGIFDPRPGTTRDIHMIIGRTDPAYVLSPTAREDMRSRFIQHGFNLHLDEGTLNGMAGNGGMMTLTGTGVATPPADTITRMQLTAVRNANIPPARRATSHFVLMATAVTLGTGTTFGFSIPGAMTSHRWMDCRHPTG